MNKSSDTEVDGIISKLLAVKGQKGGKNVNLTENEILNLCNQAREILINQPILLELEAPLKVCGNLFFTS